MSYNCDHEFVEDDNWEARCVNCDKTASELVDKAEKDLDQLQELIYRRLTDIYTIYIHAKNGNMELSKKKLDYVQNQLIDAIPFDEIEERVCSEAE